MNDVHNQKILKINKLLKFIITLDDLEIIKSVIESVIEILSEISEDNNNSHT